MLAMLAHLLELINHRLGLPEVVRGLPGVVVRIIVTCQTDLSLTNISLLPVTFPLDQILHLVANLDPLVQNLLNLVLLVAHGQVV